MEKRQLPDGPNARQRIYLIGRMRKAVKWATLFSQLCAIKGDSRTSLEAEVCLQHSFIIKFLYNVACEQLKAENLNFVFWGGGGCYFLKMSCVREHCSICEPYRNSKLQAVYGTLVCLSILYHIFLIIKLLPSCFGL